MHNVEKNFFVVGVLEQFDDTLHLFEKLLPRFFNGATEVYHSDSKLPKPNFVFPTQLLPKPKFGGLTY